MKSAGSETGQTAKSPGEPRLQRGFLEKFLRPEDVFASVLPMILLSKLVGVISFTTLRVDGHLRFKRSLLGVVYSLALLVLLGVCAWQIAVFFMPQIDSKVFLPFLYLKIFRMEWAVVLSICCISNGLRQMKSVALFERLHDFDVNLTNIGIETPHGKYRWITIVILILGLAAFSVINILEILHFRLSPVVFISMYTPRFFGFVFELLFVCCVLGLRLRFRLLNAHIQSQAQLAAILASLHGTLCDVTHHFNTVVSVPLLCLIINMFSNVFTDLYDFILNLLDGKGFYPLPFGFFVFGMVRVLAICWLCNSAVAESGNARGKVKKIILQTSDVVKRQELYTVWMSLMSKVVVFSAAGLFSVNLDLLYGMVGAVTTYLFIMGA